MNFSEIFIFIAKCLVLFVFGTFCFDIVHYILHRFERSKFALFRFLGSLHAVHHDFLDRNMKLQRQHSLGNILHHVIPETITGIAGVGLLGFFFGWLPALVVIAIRLIMFVGYLWQWGEDPTHRELARINAHRGLIWVGPHYHALHHVYVNQHYSSFVNVFDMIFGTNCQIKDRPFLVGGESEFAAAMEEALSAGGAKVRTLKSFAITDGDLAEAEVLILADPGKKRELLIDRFRAQGRNRLVPPEVWCLSGSNSEFFSAGDMTFRYIEPSEKPSRLAVQNAMFYLRRGFRFVPAVISPMAFISYLRFKKAGAAPTEANDLAFL